jgi:hypothetical protein
VAGSLQKAIQNPDCVSAFAKDLKGQLTEPPEGLCQMLKNGATNIVLHKVLPEAKPFLEEAFEEYAGLDWQRVVRKTCVFAMPFYTTKIINLPRQTWDKHKESTQENCVFYRRILYSVMPKTRRSLSRT